MADPQDRPDLAGAAPAPELQRVAVDAGGMVATAHHRATEAGAAMLAGGGNAMDAAVAAAFALGVCEPAASGLGGQTMMLIHDRKGGRKVALDGSSRVPFRALPGSLSRSDCLQGHQATTVPSTPATLCYALQRYGSKPLAEVLEPAIALAEEGYAVTPLQNWLTERELGPLRAGSAGRLLLDARGNPLPVGTLLRQPALASTLRRLALAGIEDFYVGEVAKLICADMAANGGLIEADDLAQIPWPVERQPLSTTFEGLRVFTMPPPGAGRALVEMLNVLGNFSTRARDPDTPEGAVLLAEVIRRANIDRRDRPYDPQIHPQLEAERMLQRSYARKIARDLRARLRGGQPGQGETTHLSVMDRAGNAVALTQSIERVYGAFEASPDLGFLYNNYMSAFERSDITHPYYLRPHGAPWASVSPTLVFRGRQPWLALGSPGSERIAPVVVQVLLRLLKGESALSAVAAPRLHCSTGGSVTIEGERFRRGVYERLERHGFELDIREPYAFYLGSVQLVVRDRRGRMTGVADPRRDGSAAGPSAP